MKDNRLAPAATVSQTSSEPSIQQGMLFMLSEFEIEITTFLLDRWMYLLSIQITP